MRFSDNVRLTAGLNWESSQAQVSLPASGLKKNIHTQLAYYYLPFFIFEVF